MNKEQLMLQTKQKIDDVEKRLKELKVEMARHNSPKINEEAKAHLSHLNHLSDEIKKLYKSMLNNEITEQLEFDETEKNIYNSIESFNSAYKKAGSLFKTKNDGAEKSW